MLDPRALFIVQVKDRAWLWQGAKVHNFNKKIYQESAFAYFKKL